jgi:hypothetical protein
MATDENALAPSQAVDGHVGVNRGGRCDDPWAIAAAQKALVSCIVLYILCICIEALIAWYRGAFNDTHEVSLADARECLAAVATGNYIHVVHVVGVAVVLVGWPTVLFLAGRLYSIGWRGYLLLGIGTLVPFVGLLIMMMVSSKATRVLREKGYRARPMGARLPES